MDVTTLDSIAERLNVSDSLRDITARAAYAAQNASGADFAQIINAQEEKRTSSTQTIADKTDAYISVGLEGLGSVAAYADDLQTAIDQDPIDWEAAGTAMENMLTAADRIRTQHGELMAYGEGILSDPNFDAATKNRVRKAMAEMSIIGTKAVAHLSAAMAQPFDIMHEVDGSTPGVQWQAAPGMLSLANSLYEMASEQVADYQENGGDNPGRLNTDLRASKDMIDRTQEVYTYYVQNEFYE